MFQRIHKNIAEGKLNNPKTVLIDIRDIDSFKNGHLEGAIHLTQDILPRFLEETDKSAPVLVMCYHGNSSQSVAQYLTQQGFTDVYSIDGGYEGWIEENN